MNNKSNHKTTFNHNIQPHSLVPLGRRSFYWTIFTCVWADCCIVLHFGTVLGTLALYLLAKLKKRERWRPGRQKWKPEVDIFSLSGLWLDKFRPGGPKTMVFRFIVWERSDPSSEISSFPFSFITSGTSAFSLLKLAIVRNIIKFAPFPLLWRTYQQKNAKVQNELVHSRIHNLHVSPKE